MIALNTPLTFALLHASVVISAALLVRLVIPRRFTASRATVSSLGVVCVLLVTILAFLPSPKDWLQINSATPHSTASENGRTPTTTVAVGAKEQHSAPQTMSDNREGAWRIPSAWFNHLTGALGSVVVTANAAPRGWQEVIVGFVFLGAAVGMCQIAVALRCIGRLYRNSTVITGGPAIQLTEEFHRRCDCRRTIELRETAELHSPATFGVCKAVVLLPEGWRQWSRDELAAVLAHEVAHVRRGDYLQRLISRGCVALHFFHPLVRAAARWLTMDQEYAADQLAGELQNCKRSYVTGLAKLAMRFHDSFPDEAACRRISMMPHSSDYLARRLDMLKTKEGSPSKLLTRSVSWCAILTMVVVALATTLLRSSTLLADKPEDHPPTPRMAAAPKLTGDAIDRADKKPVADKPMFSQDAPAVSEYFVADEPLFAREAFDLSFIQHAEEGAALIRVGELLRHPEIAPLVDGINQQLTDAWREWMKKNELTIDLRQVEWIAFTTNMKFKDVAPSPEDGPKEGTGTSQFMIGAGYVYLRMAHAANWQEIALESFPGSRLETFQGKTYVHIEPIPVLGPQAGRLRFPDDRTIIYACDSKPEEADESNKLFFEDQPRQVPYAWEDAWHAVEGGFITCVTDQSKSGWSELADAKRSECPAAMLPLLEKTQFYAVGWDGGVKTNRTGLKIRATCKDHATVVLLHLAASLALNRWPELFEDSPENLEKYHARLIQFFAGSKLTPSAADGAHHYLDVQAQTTLKPGELAAWLRSLNE